MESDLGNAAPAKKQVKRNVNALMKGTKDGEVIIKNVKPKTTGGTQEVIDETYKITNNREEIIKEDEQ